MTETDMHNPKFHVGQLLSSVQESRKAIRTYGVVNGYNVKYKAMTKEEFKTSVNQDAHGEDRLQR